MFSLNIYRYLILGISVMIGFIKRVAYLSSALGTPFFVVFFMVALPLAELQALPVSEGSLSEMSSLGVNKKSGGRNGVVSPDGRFIVYVDDDRNTLSTRQGSSLFLKRADRSSRAKKLTDSYGNDDFPAFSNDGKDVFFHSDRGGLTKIWKVSLRGGKPRQITFGASQEYHPAPSPDGRYLAYDSNRSGNYDIWLMDLNDDSEHQITTSPGPDFSPSWSPRGKAICYTGADSTGFQVFVKKPFVKGGSPIQITWGKGVRAHPSWSPSGKLIAYDYGENGVVNLWVTRLKKPYKASQITYSTLNEETPRWYPDSDRLLYSLKDEGLSKLASANLPIMLPSGVPQADDHLQGRGVQVASIAAVPPASLQTPMEMPEDIDFLKGVNPTDTEEISVETHDFSTGDNKELVLSDSQLPTESDSSSGKEDELENDDLVPPVSGVGETLSKDNREDGDFSLSAISGGDTLRVLQFYPKFVRGGVEPPDSISVVFDRRVSSGNRFEDLLSLIDDEGTIYPLLVNYSPHLCRLDAITSTPLEHGRKYRVILSSSIVGESGERLKRNFEWSFETNGSAPVRKVEIIEEKKFAISEMTPETNSAAADDVVECVFTKPLNPGSIGAESLMLFDAKGSKVPGEVKFPEGDYRLQLKPYKALVHGRKYRVFVSQNVTSTSGEKLNGAKVWSFTVANKTPLAIIDYEPKGFLKADSDITLHFNRPVDSQSLQTGQFFLRHGANTYSGNTIVGNGGKSLLFVPHRRYPNNCDLTLVVPPGLTDATGQEIVMEKPLTFSVKYKNDTGGSFVAELLEKHSTKEKPDSLKKLKEFSSSKKTEITPGSKVYSRLVTLHEKGFIDRNLGGDLERKAVLSRYKAALLVESAIKNMQLMDSGQKAVVRELAGELQTELHSLGVKIARIFGKNTLIGKA